MNVQVVAAPDGTLLWVSGALPGSVHDLKAARVCGLLRRLHAAGVIALADKGYLGAGERVFTPFKGRGKPAWKKQANRAHARMRGPGERANAVLKSWKVLAKLRCCPHRAGQIARAVLVLQQTESR